MLAVNSLETLLAPLNLPEISAGVNLTTIASGLNLTEMATGVNMTQISSSVKLSDMFYGLLARNLNEFESGVNFTGIARGLHLKQILSGVNLTQVVSGVQLRELLLGLNPTKFVPEAYYAVPYGIGQVKQGLWTYPTLLFAQILSSVLFGRLSDYVGRRWIFLFGNLVSFVAFLGTARVKEGASIAGLVSCTKPMLPIRRS